MWLRRKAHDSVTIGRLQHIPNFLSLYKLYNLYNKYKYKYKYHYLMCVCMYVCMYVCIYLYLCIFRERDGHISPSSHYAYELGSPATTTALGSSLHCLAAPARLGSGLSFVNWFKLGLARLKLNAAQISSSISWVQHLVYWYMSHTYGHIGPWIHLTNLDHHAWAVEDSLWFVDLI